MALLIIAQALRISFLKEKKRNGIMFSFMVQPTSFIRQGYTIFLLLNQKAKTPTGTTIPTAKPQLFGKILLNKKI